MKSISYAPDPINLVNGDKLQLTYNYNFHSGLE